MSLSTLVKTNLIVSNRETVNAIVSYILYIFMSLLLAGIILVSVHSNSDKDRSSAITVFVSSIFLYDYILTQAKLRTMSLIEKTAYALFPVSRVRSLSTRFFLFIVDKRILFYLLPMLGTMLVLAIRDKLIEMFLVFFLFIFMYLATSELFFLFYSLLRGLANRFSVRTVTQFSAIPFLLFFLAINVFSRGKMDTIATVPVVSQFTEGVQEILKSQVELAPIEIGYLAGLFILIAIAILGVSFLFEKAEIKNRLKFFSPIDEGSPKISVARRLGLLKNLCTLIGVRRRTLAINETPGDTSKSPSLRTGWHIVLVDWLIHQREERILYLVLLYPLMVIFGIIKITSRIHFAPGSLILPIFFLTQILGFYFTDHHFTGHGLRLSHIALTPLDPYKFVLAKTLSTCGLLSLMNVFVCLFCGVYLNMGLDTLLHGTFYSLFLPIVLLQLANTFDLYFPRVSSHPLISLFIIVISELILTAIYVLIMMFSLILGILFVASILYMSLAFSLPAWGKQLSRQVPILLEVYK